MRLVKMLGLAMVAAIAVMAFVGAGTASAVLCKVNQSPCKAENQWPTHSTILVSSPEVTLKSSLGVNVVCEGHATLLHEKVNAGVLEGTITLLTWGSACSGCKTVTTTTNGTFDDKATGGGNGTLLPLNTVVLLKECPLSAECTASAINGSTILTLDGGTINGTALGLANTGVKLAGSFGCGSSGTWITTKPYVVLSVNGEKTGSIFVE